MMLLIKLMLDLPRGFRLEEYINKISSSIRGSSLNKIKLSRLLTHRLNVTRHFFFNRVIRIWNSLPYIDTQLPNLSIRRHILGIFWKYSPQLAVFPSITYSGSIPSITKTIHVPCALNVRMRIVQISLTHHLILITLSSAQLYYN